VNDELPAHEAAERCKALSMGRIDGRQAGHNGVIILPGGG
jgi:hypothetical protein